MAKFVIYTMHFGVHAGGRGYLGVSTCMAFAFGKLIQVRGWSMRARSCKLGRRHQLQFREWRMPHELAFAPCALEDKQTNDLMNQIAALKQENAELKADRSMLAAQVPRRRPTHTVIAPGDTVTFKSREFFLAVDGTTAIAGSNVFQAEFVIRVTFAATAADRAYLQSGAHITLQANTGKMLSVHGEASNDFLADSDNVSPPCTFAIEGLLPGHISSGNAIFLRATCWT